MISLNFHGELQLYLGELQLYLSEELRVFELYVPSLTC